MFTESNSDLFAFVCIDVKIKLILFLFLFVHWFLEIRNRRLQFEALQHLIQLLPVPNRDTLWSLLNFLSLVAANCEDHNNKLGEFVPGNKMDSNNLATLFAPNILHSMSSTTVSKESLSSQSCEERIDVINVIRSMIDHNKDLFQVRRNF